VRHRLLRLLLATLAIAFVAIPTIQATSPAQAAERKQVGTDYTLLRRGPHSYVLGTAYRGWNVDVQQAPSGGYWWGHVYGDLNTCLWIHQDAVTGGSSVAEACDSEHRVIPESQFASAIGGGSDDGADVAVTKDASACPTHDGSHVVGYGNVRPWQDAAQPSSQVNTLVPLGDTVKWRYVSRDGKWVMVRAPQHGDTNGQGLQPWFFLPRTCVPV
jgi:hypothetical protein